MKPQDLVVRCYATKHDDLWVAVCIDLSLAVQGASVAEVQGKLNAQITEYVHDALAGDDRPYAADLLRRKAPLAQQLHYYSLVARSKLHIAKNHLYTLFDEIVPLQTTDGQRSPLFPPALKQSPPFFARPEYVTRRKSGKRAGR